MRTSVLAPPPLARKPSCTNVQCTFVVDAQAVHIPSWVQDHASFRRWVHSDEFPERTGRICYLNGEVWVDMSKEQIFTHNQVKGEFAYVLTGVIKGGRLGRFFSDGVLISNIEAALTVQPDGAFVANEGLRTGRVLLVEGKNEGYVELQGTPDMVLEVVSESSVTKDTITLQELYWQAMIPEYWIVNARGASITFEILRHKAKGYVATRKQAGWVKSAVFGKSFRLTQQTDDLGNPEYTLAVR
jgi:Uma2 family endonuclease